MDKNTANLISCLQKKIKLLEKKINNVNNIPDISGTWKKISSINRIEKEQLKYFSKKPESELSLDDFLKMKTNQYKYENQLL